MEKLSWTTEKRKIDQLIGHQKNPRKISEIQMNQLKESIAKFNLVEIPAIDSDNTILAGHQRMKAMQLIGRGSEEIDVRVPSRKLTNEEREEYLLRSNKNSGDWDFELLAEFDEALLAQVGFDSKEMDKIFKEEEEDDFDGDAEAEKIEVPVSKQGEIYQLGRHRLMCGDSSKLNDVDKLMGGVRADMVFTDPPYNINYAGRGKSTSNTIKNDNMDEQAFRTMLTAWMASYKHILKADGALYCCYASRTHREFEDALNANDFEVRNQIIWVKKVASMGWGDYRWKHEPILYCHQKGTPLAFYGDRKQYTEWTEEPSDEELLKAIRAQVKREEEGDSTVWRLHRESKYDHPTQKPIKLVSIAIRNSSKRDDIVVDLFGGSGSTLIAADGLNRTCYTMELDPKYTDVIIKRWELLTNQKAQKIS